MQKTTKSRPSKAHRAQAGVPSDKRVAVSFAEDRAEVVEAINAEQKKMGRLWLRPDDYKMMQRLFARIEQRGIKPADYDLPQTPEELALWLGIPADQPLGTFPTFWTRLEMALNRWATDTLSNQRSAATAPQNLVIEKPRPKEPLRSLPLSRGQIAGILKITVKRLRAAEKAGTYILEEINRQTWQIRIEGMARSLQSQFLGTTGDNSSQVTPTRK